MTFRLALSALAAASLVAGAPALALAQTTNSANVEASTPVPNPPAKATTAHHAKAKRAHHRKAVATTTTAATK